MPFTKELLFSCIVMVHVSFVVMRPFDKLTFLKNLENIGLPLCNLWKAEQDYVNLTFPIDQPSNYASDTWEFSDGITFGYTTKEIRASVCAISDYLGNHMPNITRNLPGQFEPIIADLNIFLPQFEGAVKVEECLKREMKNTHIYALKEKGLRILYSSRRWVEHFTEIVCES